MLECDVCGKECKDKNGLNVHKSHSHGQPWKDKETLEELHVEQGLTHGEIAERFDCSDTTIRNWCEKFGVEQKRPWEDEEILRKEYVENGKSSREVAEELGCSKYHILNWLDEYGIEKTTPTWERPPTYHTLPNGYMQIKAQHKGKQYAVQVHRLVAVAEYGLEAVKDSVIHHRNGIPWDNRPENLEPLESNSEHMKRHHEDLARTLNKRQVREIRERRDAGETGTSIAEDYPVDSDAIYKITTGKTWQWLD